MDKLWSEKEIENQLTALLVNDAFAQSVRGYKIKTWYINTIDNSLRVKVATLIMP